jgi:hypothetical protein
MELTCTGCQHRLRVGDEAIGKRIRCPQCSEIQYIPVEHRPPQQAATGPTPQTSTASPTPTGPQTRAGSFGGTTFETWRMKDARGNEYGPVSRMELDQWVAEGRVTAACEVMRSNSGRWIWASEVYPVLRPSAPAPSYPANGRATNGRATNGRAGTYPSNSYAGTSYVPSYSAVSDKSKIVAGLLGLFLGFLGVHRFYLGYPLIGFLMLITCGMFGVWSFIDSLLILLGTVPDSEGRPLAD